MLNIITKKNYFRAYMRCSVLFYKCRINVKISVYDNKLIQHVNFRAVFKINIAGSHLF